jgi:AraC-like DNA-binding protein
MMCWARTYNELVDWFNAVDLTYRSDLRELNELNFARFDAKLEQRLAELRAELLTELRKTTGDLRTELLTELRRETSQLRLEFRTELQSVRVELLRWMFGFWATTLLALAGMMIGLRPT